MTSVVHLTSVHPASDTRIFHKECRTLAHAGYRVVLVAAGAEDDDIDGVAVRGVRGPRRRLGRMTVTAARVVARASAEDADLYHVHDPELLPWAMLLKLRGKVVVFDMHEHVAKSMRTKQWIPRGLRGLAESAYRMMERLLLRRSPVLFAETSYECDYQWIQTRQCILNFPDLDALSRIEAAAASPFMLGYVGVISVERGLDVMIEALKVMLNQGLAARMQLVGPMYDPRARQMLGDAIDAGLPIHRRERLAPEAAWREVGKASVGLALLRPLPNYISSYPTKLFEYMSLGIPVVASDFPLYREIVDKEGCGMCVDPHDAGALAEAISWLYHHPAEAREMGKRGRMAAMREYNWASQGRKLLDFYAGLTTRV